MLDIRFFQIFPSEIWTLLFLRKVRVLLVRSGLSGRSFCFRSAVFSDIPETCLLCTLYDTHTACKDEFAKMSFDVILDLTAGVYFHSSNSSKSRSRLYDTRGLYVVN